MKPAALCATALALALHALLAFAQPASWTVEALRLDGQQVAELSDVQRRDKGGEPFRRVSLQRGATLPEGAEIAVPARAGVDLLSRNGNRLVLYPGSRIVLLHASGKGERYQQAEGRVRFNVIKALDFFNVHTPEKFLASVKGTEYEVNLVIAKAIEFRVFHGVVEVERTGRVRVQDVKDEPRVVDNIVQAERLSAGETKQYDLSTEQYLQEFKTYRDAEAYFRKTLEEAERSEDRARIQRARQNLGWILIELSLYQDALRIFEVQLKDAAEGSNDQASAFWGLGAARRKLSEYGAAVKDFEKTLVILLQIYGTRDHGDIGGMYNNLGLLYRELNDYRRAIEYYERSLAMMKRLFGDSDQDGMAALYQNLGNAYRDLNEYRRAIEYYEQALAMTKRLLGERDHDYFADLYQDLGIAYRNLNEYRRAIGYYEQALAMRKRLFGDRDHYGVAALYNNLGNVHLNLNEYRRAIGYFEQALAMLKRIFSERDHNDIAGLYQNLGVAYRNLTENRKAIEHYEQALAMRRRLFGDRDHIGIAMLYQNLGGTYFYLNEYQRAISHLEQSLAMFKRLFSERDHDLVAAVYNALGLSYANGTREYRRAAEFHRLALEMYVRLSGGTDDRRVVMVRRNLANALQNAGDTTAADRLRAEASSMEERLKQPKRQ